MRFSGMILLLTLMPMLTSLACRSEYAALKPVPAADPGCIEKFRPEFTSRQFRASIDVTGKHINGILVFKKMVSGNTRVLFTGTTGPTFFDFEIGKDTFAVRYCMRKLNKKAVIHTLRRDFEVLLMENTGSPGAVALSHNNAVYHPFEHRKETEYYVTDPDCSRLLRAELAGKRKKKVQFIYSDYEKGMPKSVLIEHQSFNFVIRLDAITAQE